MNLLELTHFQATGPCSTELIEFCSRLLTVMMQTISWRWRAQTIAIQDYPPLHANGILFSQPREKLYTYHLHYQEALSQMQDY